MDRITTYAFLVDRATRAEVNKLLATPRYARATLLNSTEPPIPTGKFTDWHRHGHLEFERVASAGDVYELNRLTILTESNIACGERRLYTGSDVLKVLTLHAMTQSGVPLALAPEIIRTVLGRALQVALQGGANESVVVAVTATRDGGHSLAVGPLSEIAGYPTWMTLLYVDEIVSRYLRRAMQKESN